MFWVWNSFPDSLVKVASLYPDASTKDSIIKDDVDYVFVVSKISQEIENTEIILSEKSERFC